MEGAISEELSWVMVCCVVLVFPQASAACQVRVMAMVVGLSTVLTVLRISTVAIPQLSVLLLSISVVVMAA